MNSGTRTFGGIGHKTFSAGYLGGAGTMAFSKLDWLSSVMGYGDAPGGATTLNGTATLDGNAKYVSYGRTLNLNGNSTWGPHGNLQIEGAGSYNGNAYGESAVNLAAGKTLSLQGSNYLSEFRIFGDGSFNNAGTITKTGPNVLGIGSKFNDTGTLDVKGGDLRFDGERTLGGTINIAAGSTLYSRGGTTFAPSLVLAGNGNLVFDSDYYRVNSGARTFSGAGSKTFSGGYLGGAGTMVFDKLNWTGGTMGDYDAPGGTTTVNGAATLDGNTKYVSYGRTLNLKGDSTWGPNGNLQIEGAGSYNGSAYGESVVNLAAGKTLSLPGSGPVDFFIKGAGSFNNAGTLAKTGANLLFLDGKFNNVGSLHAIGGAVFSYGSFDNTGTLAADGARIVFVHPTGPAQWKASSQTLAGGTYRVTGSQPIALNLGQNTSTGAPLWIKTNGADIYLGGAAAAIVTTVVPESNALSQLSKNNGVLSLTSNAKLRINGSLKNQGSGNVTIGAGTTKLTLNGSGAYTQTGSASTYLGGTLVAKSITFSGGNLSAGNAAGLVGNGTLNPTAGGVSFGTLMLLQQDVQSNGWDTLVVQTGDVTLDGTLAATFETRVNVGRYRFITTDLGSVSGTFDSITSNLDASLYKVVAVYGAKFVDLKVTAKPPAADFDLSPAGGSVTAVPEPQTYLPFASGLALLGWQVRRRRRTTRGSAV